MEVGDLGGGKVTGVGGNVSLKGQGSVRRCFAPWFKETNITL